MSTGSVETGVFVMPVFLDKGEQSVTWLNGAINSILAQTSPDWRLVIVEDASPLPSIESVLKDVASRDNRIHIIRSKTNQGPGTARNIGISWAYENNFPIVLFLDYDDIAHPDRLRVVQEIMANDPAIGVVYSTFQVIDENDRELSWDELSAPIQEILECNRSNPPQGETAWISIGTVTGYANLTSSTAARTEIARKHPFFACGVSEDAHAWLRYAAEGKKFVYEGSIPTLYRI
ncbi:MAG TPA: glycosyltransferase, partial [Candidatus Saccharimonadales bacterium]